MKMGYTVDQIEKIVQASNDLNAKLRIVNDDLPEDIKFGEYISIPILMGDHHIADITLYPKSNFTHKPHISFK